MEVRTILKNVIQAIANKNPSEARRGIFSALDKKVPAALDAKKIEVANRFFDKK